MVLDAAPLTVTVPRPTTPVVIPAWPSAEQRRSWLKELNRALRRPDEHGGLPAVGRLLDRLAASEPPRVDGKVWLPDRIARLSTARMLRETYTEPDIQVVASQYAEDAHRRGWLRPDRTLTAQEHEALVGGARAWVREQDRSFPELVARFGPPSVVHGWVEPEPPKSLTYVSADREAPVVAFHLAAAPAGGAAIVLAVRIDDNFLGGWDFPPYGERVFTEK